MKDISEAKNEPREEFHRDFSFFPLAIDSRKLVSIVVPFYDKKKQLKHSSVQSLAL